jgi:hypothetical protein
MKRFLFAALLVLSFSVTKSAVLRALTGMTPSRAAS